MLHGRKPEIQRPEDASIYHRIHALVADVTSATNAKADLRMARARKLAADLRGVADWLREYIGNAEEVAALPGPRAARLARSFRELCSAVDAFDPKYRSFINEHGALVEDDVRHTVDSFLRWVPERQQAFRERVRAFRAEYEQSLGADRARIAEIANEWSAVDSDGLSR